MRRVPAIIQRRLGAKVHGEEGLTAGRNEREEIDLDFSVRPFTLTEEGVSGPQALEYFQCAFKGWSAGSYCQFKLHCKVKFGAH